MHTSDSETRLNSMETWNHLNIPGCYFQVSGSKWATQELWMPPEHDVTTKNVPHNTHSPKTRVSTYES